MLFIVVSALIITICILSIHYFQHFQLKYKGCNTTTITPHNTSIMETQFNMLRASRCNYRCCLSFSPVNDESFDFFPVSFLLYLIFMTTLFILIVINELHHRSTIHHEGQFFDTLRSLNTSSLADHILVYCTLILFVWVSLFAFYRYYTTHILMQTMKAASNKSLFRRFAVFTVLFCAMFLLQIHVHYYLWSLVILLWCAFNWYCNWTFSQILIEKIKSLIYVGDGYAQTAADQEMLNGVIFTKNTSLICCALQTTNLCIFVITYNVNTLYYLSLLWSISAFILGLNFIRNRNFIKRKLLRCKQWCKCIQSQNVETRRVHSENTPPQMKNSPIELHIHPAHISSAPQKTQSHEAYTSMKKVDHVQHVQTEKKSKTPPPRTISHAQSSDAYKSHKIKTKPPLLRAITDPLKISSEDNEKLVTLMAIDSGEEISKLDMDTKCPSYIPPKKSKPRVTLTVKTNDDFLASTASHITPASVTAGSRRQKALELLGITPHSTPSTAKIPKPMRNNKQTSDTVSTTISPQTVTLNPGLKKQLTSSKSTYVTMESDEESTPTPGSTPGDSAVTPAIGIMTTQMDEHDAGYMDHEKHFDESLTVPKQQKSYTKSNTVKEKDEIHEMKLAKEENVNNVSNRTLRAPAPDHKAFLSMDMLAKYGFCDKTSINSAKQMREYQQQVILELNEPQTPSIKATFFDSVKS